MISISEKLLVNSLSAALSSIELYNKPDFKYREEIFTILNINAWELLLKAKILKDANENIESIYILEKGKPKLNRNSVPMTIEIVGAMKQVNLDRAVIENLMALIEIRDTAIHFYNSQPLSYLVYTLAVASLKNYQVLMKEWFGRSLLEYNFYILPLGFSYNFVTLSLLDLEKEPSPIANLIKSVSTAQKSLDQSSGFYFVCEIATEIRSAKKFVGDADLAVAVKPGGSLDTVISFRTQRLIDKYPVSYSELLAKVRVAKPSVKQYEVDKAIREHHVKSDPKLSAYSFRTKSQEEKYKQSNVLPKGITSIYNEDAIRFVIENVKA